MPLEGCEILRFLAILSDVRNLTANDVKKSIHVYSHTVTLSQLQRAKLNTYA